MDFFKAWRSRSTREPFIPPPVEKEREYTPVEEPASEKHLPPGLPKTFPNDWDLDTPFPKPDKGDLLNRFRKVPVPVIDKYADDQRHLWASLELVRKTKLFNNKLSDAKVRFVKVQEQDDQNRVDAREFDPRPEIRQYPAGVFIRYAEHEYPQRYIQSITIEYPGSEPSLDYQEPRVRSMGVCPWVNDGYVSVDPGNARIAVRLGSGHVFYYTTNRWQVDKLHDVLTQAWKHGVPTPDSTLS